jgi:hypothetical protein
MICRLNRGALVLGVAALLLAPGLARAVTQHQVKGQTTLIKDPKPADPTKRSVNMFLNMMGGPATVGDPTVSGATLSVRTDAGSQCISMPAAGWTGTSLKGFKFKGTQGSGNPTVSASIKTTPGGVFQNKAILKGNFGSINALLVANSAAYNFRIGNGDIYCGTFGGNVVKNDGTQFKATLAPAPGSCGPSACAVCGDGIVQIGEQCDSGGVDSATCNGATCTTSVCGDGYTNSAAGEQCDSGGVDTATCDGATCTTPVCGDSHVNTAAGEVCDPPGSAFGSGPPTDNGMCDACLSPSGAFLDPIQF